MLSHHVPGREVVCALPRHRDMTYKIHPGKGDKERISFCHLETPVIVTDVMGWRHKGRRNPEDSEMVLLLLVQGSTCVLPATRGCRGWPLPLRATLFR